MELPIVRSADVYWRGGLAGTIEQTIREATFRYAPGFAGTDLTGAGIAVHLPLERESFVTPGTFQHTFFANLLPEGFRLDALRSKVKAAPDDAFTLLLLVGADCVGDVSIVPAGEMPQVRLPAFEFEEISTLNLFERLSEDVETDESIPGVQEKISDRMVSYPARVGPKAAIIKLNPPNFPLLVANEHFFMSMAAECGLRTAETTLTIDGAGNQALLVRRFDRTEGGKLHQEDACQLIDIYPGSKYSVTTRDIARAIVQYASGGPIQLRRFLELVAFSYLIGNGDLHAKNVSLYRSEKGLFELTPAYDLLSTLPYPKIDQRMALKVEGKDANLKRAFLLRFFASLGLPEKAGASILDRLCDKSPPWIERLEEIGYDEKTTAKMRREIIARRDHLGAQ